MRFAEIAVDAPAGAERTFSYSIPSRLAVVPGQTVRVPFGPRTLPGVVFSIESNPQVPSTRDLSSVTSPEPYLSAQQLELAKWLSRYYMCTLYEAASVMLPPGGRSRARTVLSLTASDDDIEQAHLTPLQKRIVTYLSTRQSAQQERVIRAFGEEVRASISSLVNRKLISRETKSSQSTVSQKVIEFGSATELGKREFNEWDSAHRKRAPRQAELMDHLLECDKLSLTDARREHGAAAVATLLGRKWIGRENIAVRKDPTSGIMLTPASQITLTQEQSHIADRIRSALGDSTTRRRTFLIQGVTGSGKTEVYLYAVEKCISLGKQAIVLVPEIALTQQTIERFASRFQGRVAVLHSGISPRERQDQWIRMRQGEFDIVIGSRSAIFAPMPNIGLIVLDEEHEWTYKQHDSAPRYHSRDVALKISEQTDAVVILGSASPDIASYFKGLKKEYDLSLLRERVADSSESQKAIRSELPTVSLVDMRQELKQGNVSIFSRELASSIQHCLDDGQQAILFLNRRGSASHVQCRNCGFTMRCRRCDITLTLHRQAQRIICHYCGERRRLPDKCPECLTFRMSFYGIGTQAVVDEVNNRFPEASVMRWDRDSVGGTKGYAELLDRFRSGEAQVLVGTQMIAKGLHFPNVTLVGVISADIGLNIPDYRSGERSFQILCQVAGRSGRGSIPGSVVIQTYQPEHYAITSAADQDYQAFYRKEMAYRREQSNPPYSRLIRLLYTHTNQARCEQEALDFAAELDRQMKAHGTTDVDMIGPTPAFPAQLRGRYRWHIVLRGPNPRSLLDRVTVPKDWSVDVDPVAIT